MEVHNPQSLLTLLVAKWNICLKAFKHLKSIYNLFVLCSLLYAHVQIYHPLHDYGIMLNNQQSFITL